MVSNYGGMELIMGIVEIFLLGVGLAMDAFAVSICKGLSVKELKIKHALLAGLYFGGFQALMPLIGYLLGSQFRGLIENVDHWVAFALLLLIGANMIREALTEEEGESNASFAVKVMLVLAVATSIDALAVGITFAFLSVNIWLAIAMIGGTTFFISVAGIKIGHVFGNKFQKKAEIMGGVILILIGTKIVLEHLGIISL